MKVSYLQRYFLGFTFLLATFPLLYFGARSVVTIIWCFLGLVFYFKENKNNVKLNKDIWLFVSPYFLLLCSLLYTKNIELGLSFLSKILSLLIIPIPIYLNKNIFTNKVCLKILYVFCITVLAIVSYQIVIVILNKDFLLNNLTALEIKSNGYTSIGQITDEVIYRIKLRRFRHFINNLVNTHPTYQGLWSVFSIFILIKLFNKRKKRIDKILVIVLLLILLGWLVIIASRMPLIAAFISLIITPIVFKNLTKKKLKYLVLSIFLLSVISMSFKNPFSVRLKRHLETGIHILNTRSTIKEFNSSNIRNGIYYCSLNLIKNNFLFGVGVGDVQDNLNKCYKKENFPEIYTWTDYNTHNQYLFFFISNGIVGFFVFISFLMYMIRKSYHDKKKIYFYFIISVSLMFLTENILERSDGVLFFSFFNSLLYFGKIKK